MDISNKYCVFVGSARGTLQHTFCKPDQKISFSIPENKSEITALEWGRSEDEILIGYESGQVQIFDTNQNKYNKTITKIEGEGRVSGLGYSVNKSIIIGLDDGIINILKGKKLDYFSINLEEKASLDCMQYHKSRENVIGTGGVSNDFKLWDVETQQCIFKAKSLPHDELNLPVPTSIRGIAFLPEEDHLSACCTKEGHVLLYDDRVQRRPVVQFFEAKASYTCLASAFRERQCLVGTTRGYMQLLDLKAPGKCLKTFTSFRGSVTGIVCDPVAPLVAVTSLDRYLRIHNLETKELVYSAYLKQNLTKVLMKPLVKEEAEESEENVKAVDEEYDELFSKMETVTDGDKKKTKSKRKSTKLENPAALLAKKKKKKSIAQE